MCEVVCCSVSSSDTCKINEYDKIMTEKQKKRENMEIKDFFLHESPYKGLFRNGIHSLLKQADI